MCCPDCGGGGQGILMRVPFPAFSPFENLHPGPAADAPLVPSRRRGRPPMRLEGNVYVGKCQGCGMPIYRPEHLRGRRPTRCEDCRRPRNLRS